LFGVIELPPGHALGGLLVLSALSKLLLDPVVLMAIVHGMASSHPGREAITWAFGGSESVVSLATAVLQLVAGLLMMRGKPARGWLLAYVLIASVGFGLLHLLVFAYWLPRVPRDPVYVRFGLVLKEGLDILVAVAFPVFAWLFRPCPQDREPAARIGAAMPWVALWIAAGLVAECLRAQSMGAEFGGALWPVLVLGAAAAVASLIAARTTLRGERSFASWLASTVIAAMLAGVVVAMMVRGRFPGGLDHDLAALSLLVATMVTGAWLARRADAARSGQD
jgi:hypothetical protein